MFVKKSTYEQLNKRSEELQEFKTKFRELQEFVVDEILSLREDTRKNYVGNSYRTYASQVKEINKKYNAEAYWGVLQAGNIIDVRAAFIIGQGINIVQKTEEEAENEISWARDFLSFNDLDREVSQEFAKEAEIEGKFLGQLFLSNKGDDKMVSVRFRSWLTDNYKIETDPNDYMHYTKATWKSAKEDKTLEENEFVYKRFGGRINKPNISPPKIAKCLTQIEHLDKALRDWREINRIFGAPTPHIECESTQQAKEMNDEIKNNPNFKIKKFFAHTGKFGYASPLMQGAKSIAEEIVTNVKMISGTTGCPVHFLGLPDLMSNRATADNLMDLIYASTLKEREIWKGAYEEIITKAMIMSNKKFQKTPLNPELIGVDIPFITREQWKRIAEVYLPMYLADAISLETLLAKVPDIDPEEELQRRESAEKEVIEKVKNKNKKNKPGVKEKVKEEEE